MANYLVGGDRLRVMFIRNGNKVTMSILQQDESLRGKGTCWTILERDGYSIEAEFMPEIYGRLLFLRGIKRSEDHASASYVYETEAEAEAAVNAFTSLIEELNRKTNDVEHRIVGGDRLQVEFWLEGAVLRARILKQDDRLRGISNIASEDGYHIHSIWFPQIRARRCLPSNVLYVRGSDRDEDDKIADDVFPSPLAAREALEAFSRLIEKINNEEHREHRIVGGPRLKVEFRREGKTLTMQVLGQADDLRQAGTLESEGAYSIESVLYPDIEASTMYVRGADHTNDHQVCRYHYETSAQAAEALRYFASLVEQINAVQTKTLEIGPYVIKAVLTGDKLEIFREGRDVA